MKHYQNVNLLFYYFYSFGRSLSSTDETRTCILPSAPFLTAAEHDAENVSLEKATIDTTTYASNARISYTNPNFTNDEVFTNDYQSPKYHQSQYFTNDVAPRNVSTNHNPENFLTQRRYSNVVFGPRENVAYEHENVSFGYEDEVIVDYEDVVIFEVLGCDRY